MKQFGRKLSASIVLYKLAIIRVLFYSFMTLGGAFEVSVQNVDFPTMTHWNQFVLILGVLVTWSATMLAFLDKTSARIASGQAAFETGQTEFFTRPNAGSGSQEQIQPNK